MMYLKGRNTIFKAIQKGNKIQTPKFKNVFTKKQIRQRNGYRLFTRSVIA